jgi:prevent-host-death family protein
MNERSLLEARKHFGDLVIRAQGGEPVGITRYGKLLAVVVSADWYRQMTAAAEASETVEPLAGIVRLTVSTDSDVAFGLLEEAYRRTGRRDGGKDAGRERLGVLQGIMADALREYLDRREAS